MKNYCLKLKQLETKFPEKIKKENRFKVSIYIFFLYTKLHFCIIEYYFYEHY